MRVNLRGVPHTGGGEPEGVDRPLQVLRPVGAPQRQAFAQRRLVDLNHADARRLEVAHAVANGEREDRKSTRLNSSHITISYAVFCLKKKKNNGTEHLAEGINATAA